MTRSFRDGCPNNSDLIRMGWMPIAPDELHAYLAVLREMEVPWRRLHIGDLTIETDAPAVMAGASSEAAIADVLAAAALAELEDGKDSRTEAREKIYAPPGGKA